jgi:hypothetical protein
MSFDVIRSALRLSVVVVVVALGAAACGSDSDATSTPAASAEPTPMMSATATALPGEQIDFGPSEGDVVAVVGVQHDEGLDQLAAPGADQDVVATLDPLADDLVAQGQSRILDDGSIWYLVTVDGVSGWVNSSDVMYLGQVDDVTSTVVDQIGSTPSAGTMPELGLMVAEELASTDPPSEITMTAPASEGDLGEVTYDVVGLGDDSIGGYRLHVFGTPDEGAFVLKSVEQTLLCSRGSSGGLCV